MLKARICGSLVAAVAGDCIGSLYEGGPPKPIAAVQKHVKKLEKEWEEHKAKKDGRAPGLLAFTDDTAMARVIAESLVHCKHVDVNYIAKRFAEEYKKEPGRGYGGNVIKVLQALAKPSIDIYQPARELFDGAGSCGNGSAMRIAPLGLFYYKKPLTELRDQVERISRLTHSHPDALVGAVLESFAVHLALSLDNSKPLEAYSFLQELKEQLQPIEKDIYGRHDPARRGESDRHFDIDPANSDMPYCRKLDLIKEFLSNDITTDDVRRSLGTNISALGSVPTAVYCFLRGALRNVPGVKDRSEVEQTVLYAISLGGDTDTIATMAAAISGAFFGLDNVPKRWQECCEGVDQALYHGEKIAQLVENKKF